MIDLTLCGKQMQHLCEDGWHTWKLDRFSIESWSPEGVPKSYTWYIDVPGSEQNCRSCQPFTTCIEARDDLEHVLAQFSQALKALE